GASDALGLLAIGLWLLEWIVDNSQFVMALGHWLVYLQLVKMFLPKTARDDWSLFVLGLAQVVIGAVVSQSAQVGLVLFSWAFMALWVLSLFSLQRDAVRFGTVSIPAQTRSWAMRIRGEDYGDSDAKPVVSHGAVPREPYPGLLDGPFVFA